MTTNNSNVIDQETYSLLQDLMGEEGFQEIIEFFCSDTQQALGNLHKAINEEQADYVGGICHKLKSSSKLIGAFNMAQLSTELEQYSENKDTQLAAELLSRLNNEFQLVQHWIETETVVS